MLIRQVGHVTIHIQVWTGNSVMSVRNSITARNIILFQAMSVFCRRIKGMLHSKVTDNGYICGLPSEHLQINLYGFLRKIPTLRKVCMWHSVGKGPIWSFIETEMFKKSKKMIFLILAR